MVLTNKNLILTLFLFSSIFTILGCKSSHIPSKNTVTIALGSAPTTLDPTKATDATGMRMTALLYQSLVRISPELKPAPELATEWKVEGSKYTFFIPLGVKFSNGDSITCNDILSSIKAYQSDTCPFRSAFKVITSPSCKTIDQKIVLAFSLPHPSLKFILSDLPVLKIFKGNLGTGPFALDSDSPAKTILKPNEFYQTKKKFALEFQYLKDDFTRFLKIFKGEIDIAPNSIPLEKIKPFQNSKYKIIEMPSLSTSYLLINHKNKFLKDKELRKKIFKSIGIDEIVQYRFEGHVTRAWTLLFPGHPYFPRDLQKSDPSHGEIDFTKVNISLKTSNSRQARENGKIISQKLRSAGLKVKLESLEWGTFYRRDIKSGAFDLALMKWVGVLDPDLYNLAFHSNEFPPGRNRGFYSDPKLDQLLTEGRLSVNENERKALYGTIQKSILEEVAIIPLWHENQVHIVHPRIKNYNVNPMGDFYSFINLEVLGE